MYEKLNKKARSLMLLSEMLVFVVLAVIMVGAKMIFSETAFFETIGGWIYVVLGVLFLVCLISPFIRYERYRYRFTEEEIEVKEGVIRLEREIVPIERLHKISMESGPLDRIFGLSKVIVTTAGGDVVIRFLEVEKAEKIVERLKNRINSYAIESREGAKNGTEE